MYETLESAFRKYYPDERYDLNWAFCPYRVCPLGAHVDHQKGAVTGFAIDKGIEIAYVPTESKICELRSLNMEGRGIFPIRDVPERQFDWCDHLRGATKMLGKRYELKTGIRGIIYGSLPIGGLSSSAAVIICFLSALVHANGLKITKREMIDIALETENEYLGISVGKLDQSCEVLCEKDNLLYLDTIDDSYVNHPVNKNMKPFEIAIFFSGVARTLVGTAYNTRVDECKSAAYNVLAHSGAEYGKYNETYLRNVDFETYDKYKSLLPVNFRKRADHYYGEQKRVKDGIEAWNEGDIEKFGQLIFESGESSIELYETGSPELKKLYDIMKETKGIYGGRFSGAGFKGCCMAIIDPEYKESIEKEVTEKYLKAFPELRETFSVHFCTTGNGVEF